MEKKVILIATIVICLSATAFAEKKQSVIGSIFQKAKDATSAVKQDIKNYQTYLVKIEVINNRSTEQYIEVVEFSPKDPNIFNRIFEKKVLPKTNNEWTLEIIPKNDLYYSLQGTGVNAIKFHPKNQDRVVMEMK